MTTEPDDRLLQRAREIAATYALSQDWKHDFIRDIRCGDMDDEGEVQCALAALRTPRKLDAEVVARVLAISALYSNEKYDPEITMRLSDLRALLAALSAA